MRIRELRTIRQSIRQEIRQEIRQSIRQFPVTFRDAHQYAHPTHHLTAIPETVSLRELRSVMVMRTRRAPGPTLKPPPGGNA